MGDDAGAEAEPEGAVLADEPEGDDALRQLMSAECSESRLGRRWTHEAEAEALARQSVVDPA